MTAPTLTTSEQIEHEAQVEVSKLAKFAPVISVAKAYFFSHKDEMPGLSLNSVYLAFNRVQRERSVERVIFTCKRRSCKHVWAHEYTGKVNDSLYRIVDGEKQWMADDYQCPECGNHLYIESNLVVGTYNEKHICNARCMSATSGVCSCSCGGTNHGMNHL